MKIALIVAMLLFLPSISKAQGWDSVGGGLDDNVYDMIKYDGELFLGGRFLHKVKSWDGNSWASHDGLYGIAFPLSFSTLNDTLYTGGDFPYSGSESKVYRLENGTWEQVGGTFDDPSWSSTKKLINFDSIIVSGGRYSSIGGVPMDNVAYWNGTTWNAMGNGFNDMVLNFGIYHDTLYATGNFTASGSDTLVRSIARWSGTTWECFDSLVVFNSANALKSFQGDLLIGNVWDTINGIAMNGIARWDGTNYTSMGDTIIKGISEFWELNNDLYIAADLFGSSPWITERAVMKWNGSGWDQLGSQFNEWVMCLGDYNNMLYCGGQYSDPISHVARYNPFLGLDDLTDNHERDLVKIVDLLGRETEFKPNTILIYVYSDGTSEKVFRAQ